MYNVKVNINHLKGKTFKNVELINNNKAILFTLTDEIKYIMEHDQNCCETVYIDAINGDLDDLVNTEILKAEEFCSPYDENGTWTFYSLQTIKGYVDIKWYGTSNGYYSETADVYRQISDNYIKEFKKTVKNIKNIYKILYAWNRDSLHRYSNMKISDIMINESGDIFIQHNSLSFRDYAFLSTYMDSNKDLY